MKYIKIFFIFFVVPGFMGIFLQCSDVKDNSPGYEIAAYYFPNYHPNDKRNNARFGKGWSEWQLVKKAKPRFPGHNQPKIPLWGYGDESNPAVMAKKIDTAAKYGIDAFILTGIIMMTARFWKNALKKDI